MSMYHNKVTYINWKKEAVIKKVSGLKWRDKYDWYVKNGVKAKSICVRDDWVKTKKPPYLVRTVNKYKQLLTFEKIDGMYRYVTYSVNQSNPDKDAEAGGKSYTSFIERWASKRGTTDKRQFSRDFGTTPEDYKNCIPKYFHYFDEAFSGINMKYRPIIISSIDACSQFPYCLKGRLPDANYIQTFKGMVEPTEEYPFAYYLISGHFCELGGVDTRKWIGSEFETSLFDCTKNHTIDESKELTVLMKASDFVLDEVIDEMYELKSNAKTEEERHAAKLALNSLIGKFRVRNHYTRGYAHLAAVVIARSSQRMLDLCRRIGKNMIVQIAIDGIMYLGNKVFGVPESEKKLGDFVQEYVGCEGALRSHNCYMIKKDGKLLKFRSQGYNYYKDGRYIKDNPPVEYTDMKDWIKKSLLEGCE